jgi:hypothetical protein
MRTVEEILHFGVKGMHWGVRKSSSSSTMPSSDVQRVMAVKKKVKAGGTKTLTNQELQDLITRMNLEQQFSRLNPSKLKKGAQVASDILRIGGTINQAVAFVNSPAGKALRDGLTKKRG